ncbi:MAG: carbamoyl phosphate synthase small subunit [Alistipes sp.]|nr:carbamoyl phosphate synthase small subunit [Candidatus Alistipes equi]
MKRPERKLVLENGQEFYGIGFGSNENTVSEIVFNTSVVGYQEIISDPCYCGQIVVMTYPLIGNYGITDEDFESRTPRIAGLVVRECCDTPSNFRYTKTLEELLEENAIPCISGVDTRCLTRVIRDNGSMRCAIVDATMDKNTALEMIRSTEREDNLVKRVSCRKRWISRTPSRLFHVVAVDCGIKFNIIRELNRRGCDVTIVPYNATREAITSFNPDGILFSNGPGSPYDVPQVGKLLDELIGTCPIFGIGLSHELICMRYGAKLERMQCGIHGDHPIRDLETGKINIAVFNQSLAVKSIEQTSLTLTHETVLDKLIVGVEQKQDRIFSVQFQPESAPGPQESSYLFDKFIKIMEEGKNA